MTKRNLVSFALALLLGMGWLPVQAARTFSAAQTSPTPAPGQFDMGTTQSIAIGVTNTSTGGNVTERLYQVQFQLSTTACSPTPCTNTVFSSATTAPAGWTRTAFSATSVTFKANTFADALGSTMQSPIMSPTTGSFALVLVVGTFTADLSQTLSKVTARFSANTNFGGSHAVNCTSGTCLGSWKAMSLQITKFQTQTTAGVDTNAVAAGQSFLIVITVKNISTAAQNGIVAISSPPSVITRTGTWFGASPVCSLTGTSPSPLNLAAGASGTITYTCTTHAAPSPTDSGTVTYSITKVQNSTNTATSRTATSNTLSVSPLTVGIAITASAAPTACLFAGGNAKFTMTVTNNTGGTVTSVSPTLNSPTVANGANVGAYSAPTTNPSGCNASLANGSSCDFIWTATTSITGSYPSSLPQPSFSTSGFATATSGGSTITTPAPPSNTENILEYVVSVSPVAIYASSTNVELDWNVANLGCPTANVSSVAVTVVPVGWVLSPDPAYAYSLVTDTIPSANDTWTVSGTTFTAPNASSQIPVNKLDNDFYLLFSATPSTLGTSTFTVVVTDTNGVSRTQTTPVTVNALTPGSVTPWTWREIFQ